MKARVFDLTVWHRVGLYIGALMVCVGIVMSLPRMASKQIDRDHFAKTQGSPIWLERDNNVRRGIYFNECINMPAVKGDIPRITCAGEANSLYPDRNWKKVAEENMKGK